MSSKKVQDTKGKAMEEVHTWEEEEAFVVIEEVEVAIEVDIKDKNTSIMMIQRSNVTSNRLEEESQSTIVTYLTDKEFLIL